MSLKEYIRKRNFKETAEPTAKRGQAPSSHRFVVQKHAASHLHYDFRLEIGGVLKSWAVPKGISFAKGEKRLAVEVEDHPVSYIDFEGVIPQGQYGGGTVMVWDRGTFEPLSRTPAKELAGGKLHFVLHGKKLNGEWYLVRLHGGKQWLLIRAKEDMRPVSKTQDDTSALSSKTMKELAVGKRVWTSKPAAPKIKPVKSLAQLAGLLPHPNALPQRGQGRRNNGGPIELGSKAEKTKARSAAVKFIEPMKARLMASPPAGDWIYEIKFDGFRALAFKTESDIRLLSRNQKDLGGKFPEVTDALAKLPVREAILDGEIVALDPKGKSSFQLLQGADMDQKRPRLFFYAFDLLQLNGQDLRQRPLVERKRQLEKLLARPAGTIRYSASLTGEVASLLAKARELGLEGLVGKQKDSLYEAGLLSGAWIKLKLHQEQEFVIGGYTEPSGSRKDFGSLLVGVYEGNALIFCGKVGTGFDRPLLKSLLARFKRMARASCPFTNLPEKKIGKYGQGVTARAMLLCHWIKTELVCQVKFSEWTRDGKLRQPVFLGLREDKSAREVVREKAESA